MANRRMEFLIGMTVVVIFVAVSVMTILFGPEQGIFVHGGGKRMTIVFDKANGITNTSKVVKSGVEIGRVFKRELRDEPGKSEVRVSFELNPDVKIYSNEYARINRNFLGDAAIEFVKNVKYTGEVTEIGQDQTIVGQPGADISGTVSNIEGDLAKTLERVQSAAAGITLFMDNVNTFMGTPEELQQKKNRLQAVFTELSETLQTIKGLSSNMNDIMADKTLRANIHQGAREIPNILSRVNELMGNANKLTMDFHSTLERTHRSFDQVEKNLDNLGVFTSSLAEDGPEFISSLSESSKDIRRMVGNISELAEELNRDVKDPNTTLGMLGDPKVAASIRGIIANAEDISVKMQPIMDDARVFTNKIAHRPSSLVFGGQTYKGLSGGTASTTGLQSLSPTAGTGSSLFRLTSADLTSPALPYPLSGCPDDQMDSSRYPNTTAVTLSDPNGLENWYSQYPQNVAKKTSCFDNMFGRFNFSFCSKSKEPSIDMQSPFGSSLTDPNDFRPQDLNAASPSGAVDKSRAAKQNMTPPDVRQIDQSIEDEATLKERGRRRWLPFRRQNNTSNYNPSYGNMALIDGQEVSFMPEQVMTPLPENGMVSRERSASEVPYVYQGMPYGGPYDRMEYGSAPGGSGTVSREKSGMKFSLGKMFGSGKKESPTPSNPGEFIVGDERAMSGQFGQPASTQNFVGTGVHDGYHTADSDLRYSTGVLPGPGNESSHSNGMEPRGDGASRSFSDDGLPSRYVSPTGR